MTQTASCCDSIPLAGVVSLPGRGSSCGHVWIWPTCSGGSDATGTPLATWEDAGAPSTLPHRPARSRNGHPGRDCASNPMFAGHGAAHAILVPRRRLRWVVTSPTGARAHRKRTEEWFKELRYALEHSPESCGRPRPTWTAGLLSIYLEQKTGTPVNRTHRAPAHRVPRICLPASHLDGATQSGSPAELHPQKEGVEALLSAAASTPPVQSGFPACTFILSVTRQAVVDPADKSNVASL